MSGDGAAAVMGRMRWGDGGDQAYAMGRWR